MATIAPPEPTTAPLDELPVPAARLYRLTVAEYLKMIEAGALNKPYRFYLWKGLIVTKMTKARPHIVVTTRLFYALIPLAATMGYVESEQPVKLRRREDTMPEPDLKVIRGRDKDYPDLATTADVPLIIEVADSSLLEDRRDSMRLYAVEGIPVYWIANIPRLSIEVYSDPSGPAPAPRYGKVVVYERGQSVPVVLDGAVVGQIAVSDIFQHDDPWLPQTSS